MRARIERRWLMLFKQTTEYLERQKPRVAGVPEMVEDIMLKRRLQRSEAAWKVACFVCMHRAVRVQDFTICWSLIGRLGYNLGLWFERGSW